MKRADLFLLSQSSLKQLPSEGLTDKINITLDNSLINFISLVVCLWKALQRKFRKELLFALKQLLSASLTDKFEQCSGQLYYRLHFFNCFSYRRFCALESSYFEKASLINFKSSQSEFIKSYISVVVFLVEGFEQGALRKELFIAPLAERFKAVTFRRFLTDFSQYFC